MWLFFTLLLTITLAGVEVDIFTPSFPELRHVFNLNPFSLQLMLSINFIGFCLSSIVVGFLGDRFGRRIIILQSLTVFIIGSILCVWAENYSVLLLGRFLQGLGMSGPSVLAYVVIADKYTVEQQKSMMGILNGVITSSMAFAPVVGSYINAYFQWRGNFLTLLGLSIICWILCFITLPPSIPNKQVKTSLKAYVPLLRSQPFWLYVAVICPLITCYWVFVGLSPLLYMEDMQVPLKSFGFYQGALAASFSLASLISPLILKNFAQQQCIKVGMLITLICGLGSTLVSFFFPDHPLFITLLMCGFSIGLVFPINVLYPVCLEIVPEAKGRASAFIMATRLIANGIAVELIGYVYNHHYYPIALFTGAATLVSYYFIIRVPEWRNNAQQTSSYSAAA
jgi:MFS transporter, DHA1 family, multidrug resistance protein